VDSGKTDTDGLWQTRLDADGREYDVKVFNGNTITKIVQMMNAKDVYLEFSLERLAPAPRLVVSNVDYSPSEITPGDIVNMSITITNMGTLNANASLLTFIAFPTHITMFQTGTTFNLGALDINATVDLTARVLVDLSATTGPHLLQYEMSYTSDTGYSYEYEGAFGIFVGGFPEVKIHNVIVDPSTLNRGTDGVLTLELINAGTEVADGVTVRIQGAEILTSTTGYAGRIERDNVVDVVFGIHVYKYENLGTHLLNATVTYMDPKGNSFAESKLLEIDVVAPVSLLPTYDLSLGLVSVALAIVAILSLKRLGVKL
jgi:hypothetical protein